MTLQQYINQLKSRVQQLAEELPLAAEQGKRDMQAYIANDERLNNPAPIAEKPTYVNLNNESEAQSPTAASENKGYQQLSSTAAPNTKEKAPLSGAKLRHTSHASAFIALAQGGHTTPALIVTNTNQQLTHYIAAAEPTNEPPAPISQAARQVGQAPIQLTIKNILHAT